MSTTKIIADGLKRSFFEKFVGVILKHIEKQAAPMHKRLDALETRDRERSFGRFLGSHQRAMLPNYKRGDVVVHDGGLWLALRDAPGELPGEGWQLVVRGGQKK